MLYSERAPVQTRPETTARLGSVSRTPQQPTKKQKNGNGHGDCHEHTVIRHGQKFRRGGKQSHMGPAKNYEPEGRVVSHDGEKHCCLEIPPKEQELADTMSADTAPWTPPGATKRAHISMGEHQSIEEPQGARKAWLNNARAAEKKIREALSEASKRHDRTTAREHARRLGNTGRIIRELLGARRANEKEILTIGGGKAREHLYIAYTVHRDFSGHFDKHFVAGSKKRYRRSEVHPLFRMGDHGKACREEVLQGTVDPSLLPTGLRGSL